MSNGKHIWGVTLRKRDRLKLEEVAPLDHPLIIYTDVTNTCNFQCKMCPTGNRKMMHSLGIPQGKMSMELWKKMIADLQEFGQPAESACMVMYGEALVHPQFPEMLRLFQEAGVVKQEWIKTNGSLLTPEINRKLINAGIDYVGISVEHVTPEGYEQRSGVKNFDYEKFRATILDLYNIRGNMKLYIKIPCQGLTEAEIEKFYHDFDDRCDYIGVENLHGWSTPTLHDFTLGQPPVDTYDGDPLIDKIVCPWIVYTLSINWNGTVCVCPEDWAQNTIVGDIHNESLKEIWNGERMYEFRKMHLEGRRVENLACRGCYFIRVLPDVVDPYRAEMLKRYTAQQEEFRKARKAENG